MASLDDRRPCNAAFPSTNRDREVTVKTQLRYAVACAVVSVLTAFPAFAAEGTPKPAVAVPKAVAPADESQQDRMRRCNATAKEKSLTGDERRTFMSSCLKR